MATTKISDLSALTSIATDDEFVVVDKSDTTSGAAGTTKKITNANFLATIQAEVDDKAPIADPTFTGEIGIGAVNVSETELGILEGATLTTTELNYVDGVTSDIQTQLNTIPTDLTDFTEQTAWRVFYSDSLGDVTELALGADGTFLKSNGATSAPTFAVPEGSGDVSKVGTPVNNQIGIWTGDGTLEGDVDVTYDGTDMLLGATAATTKLQFRDAAVFINSATDGHLDLDADVSIDLNADTNIGGTLALGANNITMSGSLGVTGTRLTKGWFTDLECTNAIAGSITGNAATATAAASQVITDNAIVTVDDTDAADNDYAKFTANGLEGRSYSEVRTDLNVADGANAYVHPNHSGDVTSVADGAQTIANNAVTYAKMQNVVNDERVLGRVSGADGVVEELTKAQVLTMLNVEDGAEANNISDVNATDLTDGGDTTLHDHDGITENTAARHTQNTDTALGSGCVAADHGTAATDQVVNVCYGTSETPPTASTTTEGTLYIQYTA